MSKKIASIVVLILLVIIAAVLFFYFRNYKNQVAVSNYPSNGTTIVAFGDSLTYGYGATEGKDYVSDLSTMIGEPIVNLGKNGDTTGSALSRVDDVLAQDPKIVLVLLGGNDFLQQVPKDQTFQNLDKIVTKIQAKGAVVILLGVQGGLFGDEYRSDFEALAARLHTGYVPNVLDGIIGHNDLMSDPIHPNDAGYKIIALKVYPVLKKYL